MADIQLNDTGTLIELQLLDDNTPINLTGATVLQIKFKKPDGVTITKTATITGSGADGLMGYVSEANFFNLPGTWLAQAIVTLSGGWSGRSAVTRFSVVDNL